MQRCVDDSKIDGEDMTAVLDGDNVRARCPDCDGALTTFESRKIVLGGSVSRIDLS